MSKLGVDKEKLVPSLGLALDTCGAPSFESFCSDLSLQLGRAGTCTRYSRTFMSVLNQLDI
jgi:hypothetical protein